MNDLQVFNNTEFGSVRTITIDGKIMFVGKDVCDILEYQNGSRDINRHVDEDDRQKIMLFDGTKENETIVINESGLYSLIFSSRMPNAKKFKRWVTSEVIPSIRENGYYDIGDNKKDSYMIEDPAERARRWAEEYEEKKLLECKVTELKPKADYFDGLVDSKLLTTFRDAAKEFQMSPKSFNKWLTDHGYIYRDRHGIIKPYEQYRKSGLFQLKDFKTPHGYSNVQTYLTIRGKETFRLLMGVEQC
uniref:Repressor domain protein n=1 Tax=virus sp. ctQmo6 TaxID=2827990 RepID=A0A8S5RFY9_9VIRU|nr:MAG TPA: repressor domain protein [virus sp. ctQmo6]